MFDDVILHICNYFSGILVNFVRYCGFYVFLQSFSVFRSTLGPLLIEFLGTILRIYDSSEQIYRDSAPSMSSTMAVHLRYTFWYISLAYSATQQREVTEFFF